MGFLFSQAFWGALLILLGCSMVLKVFFKVEIPVFRIAIALIFIYIGIRIMMGWSGGSGWVGNDHNVIFGESQIKATTESREYNLIFGHGDVDFTEIVPVKENVNASLNAVFGAGNIRINPAVPTKVVIDCAFASARVPNNQQSSFGNLTYTTPAYKEGQPCLYIKGSTVFGSLEVWEQPGASKTE